MRKVILMFLMVFLVFGILLHSPLVSSDENDSSSDNESGSDNDDLNGSLDDENDDINDSDEDEDELEDEDDVDSNDDDKATKDSCIIKIEREIKIENGKRAEVIKRKIVCADGTRAEVKVRIENRTENGRFRERIRYEVDGEELETEAQEGINLEEETNGTEYKLKARFRGNVTDIKIMPDRASEIALERLRALNFTIELREVSREGNVSRIAYSARAYKDGRFVGIFKLKVKVETQIDPETGEIIRTKKPWWAFFVSGEDSDQIGKKTVLCHIPPGNSSAMHTISVGTPAVAAHLAHGDYLGTCNGTGVPPGNQTAPQWFDNSTNSTTVNGTSIEHRVRWTDNTALSGYIFSFDNGDGSFINDSFALMSGTGNWSNVSKVVNSTVNSTIRWRVYANDSSNNWNVTDTFSYMTTSEVANVSDTQAPQWFDNSTNSTANGTPIEHRVRWTDNVSLSGYIFSFDNGNNGSFLNDSFVAFSGLENWSNITKSINSTINTTINWKVYANDTSNNWNATDNFSYGLTSQ